MLDQILDSSLALSLKTPILLLILIILEAVLSADNAIALAAIAQGLKKPELQRSALNIGLVVAYVLRMSLILTATWVVKFWQFELLGASYLLWLVFNHFTSEQSEQDDGQGQEFNSLWQTIPLIAVTDLAFSLDSVTTAIALADELWLILAGGTIGVITLRFLAELFIRWLKKYTYLEDAGFITVGFVGLRLLVRVINPELVPPQWLMISAIALVFAWGFSKLNPDYEQAVEITEEPTDDQASKEPEKISS
ncbi:TerC family protein [Crocosphaera sp. Alani8]|uniref:TerC family protein n=1 Tax=Crocosphaera sp. Alani8 TaxID=3038952 RepID=UPI00313B6080